jgi:hypothetical protein
VTRAPDRADPARIVLGHRNGASYSLAIKQRAVDRPAAAHDHSPVPRDEAVRLTRVREALGFSQRQMADELGVTHGAIGLFRMSDLGHPVIVLANDDPPGRRAGCQPR